MRKMILLGVAGLGLAAAFPAVFYTVPGVWKAVREAWYSTGNEISTGMVGEGATGDDGLASPPVEGPPTSNLAEVLRFDVTADWIQSRWPQVATGLAHLQLQGYRVPLVTGTDPTDLAGALTYYFNPKQQVQRITFHGTTGDAQKLVSLLTNYYRFVYRPANDPGLFVYESASPDGKIHNLLRVRQAGVLKSSDPLRRFSVDLVMERPS
ncbi:MAG TPA: DUF6690 family protein [Thermoguttaceae bacterium]|nr:DUF6690 family protein [Thermoguttaceae bacterium]